jgi:ABC-type lipoprotein release transport system permease subunit
MIAAGYVATMLFGTNTGDPLTYVSVLVLVVTTSLAASWIPARRAAHVDPVQILGAE